MEQEEKTLDPQDSLRVIRETIDLAKHSFRDNGFHFLLWGWLVVVVSAAHYYFAEIQPIERPYMVWMIMLIVGVPAALIREWRRAKRERVHNIVHDWYGLIWLGFAVSMILTIPMSVRHGLSPVPFILVLIGFATFMSGVLLRFRPLLFGAVVMWAGALWCFFLTPAQHMLIQGACAILGYLVPGYLLNYEARKYVQGT
ncbi:MAG: hypothetical protein KDC61_12315 [Saprospiraceae bacterium]|nr:hypothetical protein [Saprospiraceae bacterium]MCB9355537.1 hypothetical protein [Lewinellaceae bacterium]